MVGAGGENPLGNEILPLGNNGTFLTLPYRVAVVGRTSTSAPANTTAVSVNGIARIDSRGIYTHSTSQDVKITWTIPAELNLSAPHTRILSVCLRMVDVACLPDIGDVT
eukprot:COSAG01_NODE_9250_length_2504_cov_3.542067_2_plen_109_part_00